MADVITLIEGPKEPQELKCSNCGKTSFLIFPDSIVTCCSCKHIMELMYWNLVLTDHMFKDK